MDTEDQGVDATFGQARAFSLEGSLVDPNVILYLRGVRQEALSTSAISSSGRYNSKRHTADLYDDERPVRGVPGSLLLFEQGMGSWIEWFEQVQHIVVKQGLAVQEYDETTLNLLLHYLKGYLTAQSKPKGISMHILNILQDLGPVEENQQLEIDTDWAESMLRRFRTKKIKGLADLKNCITDSNECVPMGFKEWYRFCQDHEPVHSYFTKTINSRNIWVLVQYMSHDWIKDIHKQKKVAQARRFGAWLLYILFHLPTNVTAEYVSNLRELGKKCQRAIMADASANEPMQAILVQDLLTSEMDELSVPRPPKELDILRLTLAAVTVLYRQRDLTNWQEYC